MRAAAVLAGLLLLAGCQEGPVRFEDARQGVKATFPGRPMGGTFQEDTPFGTMLWYNHIWTPPGRMDLNWRVDVGNLPPGRKGGDTSVAVLATFQAYLEYRLGRLTVQRLGDDRGPGFSYRVKGPSDSWIAGVVVVRRARIHHAQATVASLDDPALRTFLDSFEVAR